jgi:hypothetical protein
MTVSTSQVGQIFNGANDISQFVQQLINGNVDAGTFAGAVGSAAGALQAAYSSNPALAQALNSLGLGAVATQLNFEFNAWSNAVASGNTDAQVMAALGLVSAVGNLVAGIAPTPEMKSLGLAVSLLASAAKAIYPQREALLQNLKDLSNDLADVVRAGQQIPIVFIDPSTAIEAGLVDPQTMLPKVPLTVEAASELARRVRAGDLRGKIIGAPSGVRTNSPYHSGARTRAPAARDPLAIDLDSDGIETTSAATVPILFDHNADGIRTGTGWVRPDDAWLALDRDGNGLIDSGRELFGVDTLLTGTPGVDAVYASTGFEALRTLDTNADNVFNASDAGFTQVRLWQDANQDGVSQAGELFTLAAKGIASISLNATTTNINLGNGNTVSGTATVTRSNGSTTEVDAVGVASDTTAANLNLASNPFYREFTTPVPLTQQALSLPEMRGSGWVRDLREAMTLMQ